MAESKNNMKLDAARIKQQPRPYEICLPRYLFSILIISEITNPEQYMTRGMYATAPQFSPKVVCT